MAFDSKVVFLLLLSILAWCQVSSATGEIATALIQDCYDLIEIVTQVQVDAEGINELNAVTSGYKIPEGLNRISSTISSRDKTLQSIVTTNGPLSDEDATRFVDALTALVQAELKCLKVVREKHNIVALVFAFEDIREALETLKKTIDARTDVTALIPAKEKNAETGEIQTVDGGLTLTIQVYS